MLPAVREDIKKNKKLNYHYYQALIKAFYKPAAWFKGILFPLCKVENLKILGNHLKLNRATIVQSKRRKYFQACFQRLIAFKIKKLNIL